MNTADRLRQLKAITDLMRDRDLSRLSLASLQKAKIEALLGSLDKTHSAPGLDPIVAAQVVDRFGLWTTNRRILLNQQLSRATADWLGARADAQRSFGRAEVVDKLTSKR
ncbi:MAG: hypothetical protein U0934_02435 [Pseudotabrizicola sp.]|uniref:hypothetical protein n=1 Tax=Pseudotabrizicola sp. TaxID=2939647 RepID=UPI00272A78F4|nr:hypothetical protein [Pseudotabrizicola sp.]MDP2082492.1 hypothetical protein [Pseudotabrizicola sp.]MDZ7572798.1 hypothetical protein [Pseudotabrizicola sp.]